MNETTGSIALHDLPAPPEGKTGWPWTEQSDPLPEAQPDDSPWPKISIVTPSYNQGSFIEETIRSVLLQGYPNLEYVIMDGGSTDNTVEIIQKYAPWIDQWVSEPDQGQSHAINKGFRYCGGLYGNWLNSDDLLCKNALSALVSGRELIDDVVYVGECVLVDRQGNKKKRHRAKIYGLEDLILNHEDYIPQPACLFSLERFREIGGVDLLNHRTMDFDLWGKMMTVGVSVIAVNVEVAKFRSYDGQKVGDREKMVQTVVDNARRLIQAQRGWSPEKKAKLNAELDSFSRSARLGGGRLVEWGLPESFIRSIRRARAVILGN